MPNLLLPAVNTGTGTRLKRHLPVAADSLPHGPQGRNGSCPFWGRPGKPPRNPHVRTTSPAPVTGKTYSRCRQLPFLLAGQCEHLFFLLMPFPLVLV